ncbi:DUF917 domain-containing protein [Scopulibacillus cellulosilyticus]|uniref:DUF917 domain-containing protein n=1 Tax=Scopulibacillus cellulosilyticus TaxID=2665665 RepID=A0ABW2Q1B9_9BACL
MNVISLDQETVKAAVYGGAVLGGGGGGWISEGLENGRLALELGDPKLVAAGELNDEDIVVSVALVGAPAAKDQYVKPSHYVRAIQLLSEKAGGNIAGIITNENGGGTTINGWIQSALTGLTVVDAPCNGRAHPTGTMGSLNLTELDDYVSHQAAVGGKGDRYVESVVSGNLDKVSSVVRYLSIQAGGVVAVARNPVSVGHVKENGAPGAIQQAIEIGRSYLSHASGESIIQEVVSKLNGRILTSEEVTDARLETKGGFDVGTVRLSDYELSFWNEYMTAEKDEERLGTFPDLIMTLDTRTGKPVVTAEVQKGQHLTVIHVPKEHLLLSTTMKNSKLLKAIEPIIEKKVVSL